MAALTGKQVWPAVRDLFGLHAIKHVKKATIEIACDGFVSIVIESYCGSPLELVTRRFSVHDMEDESSAS